MCVLTCGCVHGNLCPCVCCEGKSAGVGVSLKRDTSVCVVVHACVHVATRECIYITMCVCRDGPHDHTLRVRVRELTGVM